MLSLKFDTYKQILSNSVSIVSANGTGLLIEVIYIDSYVNVGKSWSLYSPSSNLFPHSSIFNPSYQPGTSIHASALLLLRASTSLTIIDSQREWPQM